MTYRSGPISLLLLVFLLLSGALLAQDRKIPAREFRPVSPEELGMKENRSTPGADAVILEWSVDRDDAEGREYEYFRIKVFTEQGKKNADVEIPYYSDRFAITDIKARTVQPDGTIVPFNGKIFDKIVIKTGSYQIKAKTFTFPDVRPGSILEYHYKSGWDQRYLYTAHWDLQRNLFVRKARFNIKPNLRSEYFATYVSVGLTQEQQPSSTPGAYLLELSDLPAFVEEPFSLPESQLKPNISFYYTSRNQDTPDQFWARYAKETSKEIEGFIGNRAGIKQAVAKLIDPADSPEAKLKKIYASVQKIRNLSYESNKVQQEQGRSTPNENKNVEDVLKNGYGRRRHLNRLFVAMARAAGLEAMVARVSQRDAQIFQKLMLDESQLDGEIAVVRVGDKDILLDPATPFCPYGLLSWENTGVTAIVINKDGGRFLETPMPEAKHAILRRNAELNLDADGNLKGTVTVEFDGHYGMQRRINALETDEAEQKKSYEKELERWLAEGAEIKLTGVKNLTDSALPLRLEYEVNIPNATATAGARTMLPMLVFQGRGTFLFESPKRTHPLYFRYPYHDVDEVKVKLPAELEVENVPVPTTVSNGFADYRKRWEKQDGALTVTRQETMNGFVYAAHDYLEIRAFLRRINAGDKETAILRVKK
jgi:transglutaminase-like putative cysteine protease